MHHHTTCRRPSRRMLAERLPVQTPAAFKRWSCHQTTTRSERDEVPTSRRLGRRQLGSIDRLPGRVSRGTVCHTWNLVRLNAHCLVERLRSALTALAQERQRSTAPGRPGALAAAPRRVSPHAVGVPSPGAIGSYDSERSCEHLRRAPIRPNQFAPARHISVLRADELPAQAESIEA